MAARILPTPEQLRELLRYEPDTGKLFWKERGLDFSRCKSQQQRWNTRHAGKEALTSINNSGYRNGHVLNSAVLAHRVIWAMETGKWPDVDIDHKSGDRLDNRWSNLRQATKLQNARNKAKTKGTTFGLKGVAAVAGSLRFQARISVLGKLLYLGIFDTAEAAHAAYCEAAKKYHGEFARTE
ncbi:Pathogenesis-related transcriptional factor and ERF protein [Delftia acidovorans SPH-1]|uniref:Pathogenesis-related transcriptional factor and ERF protein n=1 Tax=Delftia acidovorans (strain DSM 14801 / SPH-1) TaxID=398578 RepID=A9C0F7_DELAS|nr:HNH endonuclease [Delftia acidovorans]ABX36723.1 Pathogenesis-related transcriptional factor and ERF protein [Delftia acidovorans SPH-1]QPS74026.1 HNH endonuclease [Delftia acidovorans]